MSALELHTVRRCPSKARVDETTAAPPCAGVSTDGSPPLSNEQTRASVAKWPEGDEPFTVRDWFAAADEGWLDTKFYPYDKSDNDPDVYTLDLRRPFRPGGASTGDQCYEHVTLTIRHKKEFRGPFDNTANHTESTNDTGAYQFSSEPTKAELLGLLMDHHPVADFKLSREGGILPDVSYHSRKLFPIQQSSDTQQDDDNQLGNATRHMEVSLRSGLDGIPPHAYTHLWFDPATGGYKPPVSA